MDIPTSQTTVDPTASRLAMAPLTFAGFLVAVVAIVVIAFLSYGSLKTTAASAESLTQTVEVLAQLQALLSTLKDAETGQRGYLLTGGRDGYLEPYTAAKQALPAELAAVRNLTAGDPVQQQRLAVLQSLAADKMQELGETIELKRAGRTDAALDLVLTDRGKNTMDQIRNLVRDMESSERQLIALRTAEWRSSATVAFAVTGGGSAVLLFLIGVAAAVASREFRTRQLESWLRAGQIGLSEEMQGDQPLDSLGQRILEFLARFLNAQVGAVFIANGRQFRRVAGYAIATGADAEMLRLGDGLTGQAAKDNRALHVRDLPPDYLPIGSATGRSTPDELLIAPASSDGTVHAVLELGFFGAAGAAKQKFLERVSESIAVAVRASTDRSRLEELLHETQQQAEELQTREEELRVNNEELEEQGRTLRESRAQLESQQAELEQINAQLEEQTQVLEHQKEALAKSHAVLSAKSAELQRANDYKSEFLANMSHELRTPLNSTLILAKLLADNKEGNLSERQVKFAQTISSAGNDLLTLINDVLDLSRIESGKIELMAEPVSLAATIESLAKTFQPAAEQKKLGFSTRVDPNTPDVIETDPQRLGQILKNLLSNALKFTEQGDISLRVFAAQSGAVSFAVRDTGVGIEAHQQEVIFEAFRQADGSIHRKYGGTGLGLSISRDLARLLGGTIGVKSAPGEGSTFTLTLPARYSAAAPAPQPQPQPAAGAAVPADADRARTLSPAAVVDDRESLIPGKRLILVIEDDMSFALILRDLAHEMGFQSVVTHSAADGLLAASQFQPSAILLDMNLPDFSGLGVLDQLKHNPRTRHIPVHIVSVADSRREALQRGAVGYALKPVNRDELVEALRRMESKISQGLRRVLIVEDDPRQRESIRELLSNGNVQISAVETANEALHELSTTTFDCVVLDFNLPDLSGYDLLEKMAHQDGVSFPPVIVYTGRALSLDEEQRLRRYSNSIIIKDARSPERLLDEVTLFLHQVESKLSPEQQQMLKLARNRESSLEGRRILVVEDDVRNIFALSSLLEPKGAAVEIARNGKEALAALSRSLEAPPRRIDMVLMDIMMPEMDGFTAMREIRKHAEWKKLPIIALTAKAMKDDQEKCLAAGANDYIAKPLDIEQLLSLVRVWMPK
jgi:CheY-like chemotaxis protein/CHASE3 domain sensor protein